MSAFKSPFEKLSYEAQREIADSVSPGGPMYNLLEDIAENIEQLNARESDVERVSLFGGLTMKEALAWRILGEKGLTSIAKGFGAIAEVIDKMSTSGEEAKERMEAIGTGLVAIKGLGKAILEFAGYLLLATPLLLVGVIAAPLFALSIFVITKALAFAAGPLTDKKIRKTLVVLGDVGKSIFMFGAWLALSLLVYPFAILAAPIVAGTILVIGGVFFLLKKMKITKSIHETAEGLAMAGLSILALGVSIALFGLILPPEQQTYDLLAFVGMTIVGVAIAFALVGIFEKQIAKGAAALALAGLSIMVISAAIYIFNEVISGVESPWELLGMIGAAVLGLGIALVVLGALASMVIQGAVALLIGGIALITIALGIKIFADAISGIDSPWEFLAQVGVTVIGLGVAFAAGGFVAPFIIAGAGAMIVAGIALITLGAGLMVMSKVFQGTGWQNMVADSGDTGFFGGSVSNLEKLLAAVGYAFMWDPIRAGAILVGSSSMLVAGAAMVMIGKGIEKFQALEIDYETFPGQMSNIVETLATVFGKIGEKYGGAGMFGLGGGLVYQGISSVMGMGDALSSIAAGMVEMSKLRFPRYNPDGSVAEYITLDSGTMTTITSNVATMVETLAGAFGDVAQKYPSKSRGGVLGFLGFTTENPVSAGIRSVRGIGDAIGSLARGMLDMAKLKFPLYEDPNDATKVTGYIDLTKGDTLTQVTNNIGLLIKTLAGEFEKIAGDTYYDIRNKSNKVGKGAEIVGMLGQPLSDLAIGLKNMAEMKFPLYEDPSDPTKITGYLTLTGGELDTVLAQTRSIVNGFADIYIEIGKRDEDAIEDGSTVLSKMGGSLGNFIKSLKGASGDEPLAPILGNFAQFGEGMKATGLGYMAMSRGINNMDIEKLTETRKMMEALSYISQNGPDTAITELGDSLKESIDYLAETMERVMAELNETTASAGATNAASLDRVVTSIEGSTTNTSTGNQIASLKVDQEAVVAEIKRLQNILTSGDVQVQTTGISI